MALPKQVQDQKEALDQFDAQVEADQTAAAAAETPAPEIPSPAPQPEATAPEPELATPAAEQPWEQRYKSLKGIFDAQAASASSQVGQLTRELEDLRSKILPAPDTPAPALAPKASTVTAEDAANFGADLLDVIKRQATDVAHAILAESRALVDSLKAEIGTLKGQLEKTATHQVNGERTRYFEALKGLVPNYAEINADPVFLNYMREVDPIAGHPRQVFLDSAFDAFDVNRTALVFKQFQTVHAPIPAATPAVPAPVVPAPSVTPATTAATPPPAAPTETPAWSRAGVEAFYADCGRGKYRDNPAEQQRIEAEIDAAIQANRITA